MKVLVTGSSGKVGRAIYIRLCAGHDVIGYDQAPSSTSDVVGSLEDTGQLRDALAGVDAVVHTAALHAPHVGVRSEAEFERVNVRCTSDLVRLSVAAGIRRFVFTSTTALYGAAATPRGRAGWVTEDTVPEPRTIYHRTKLQAESLLEAAAGRGELDVAVLRMSRCFPEPAPVMAAYRLHRGVDARDVADAHAAALESRSGGFRRFIISGATPFVPGDCKELLESAPAALHRRAPELVAEFARRGWELPGSIDRVYCSYAAARELGWNPQYGFGEVLAEYDRRSPEVLPLPGFADAKR
jgi:nucleoside-diphosphate-sugar epimerase